MPSANNAPASAHSLAPTRLEMVEACGRLCQLLSLPRSLGQIYGLLYLSPKPLSLDEIAGLLGISKASASTGTRQLAAWNGIRQVWVPGERRDHFEVEAEPAGLIRSFYADLVKPRLDASERRLSRIGLCLEDDLHQGLLTREEHQLCAERLKKFARVQKKLQSLIPLAEKFL
jgi:HTH-type transcriptional regulator, glycine betaine synthesis regulator